MTSLAEQLASLTNPVPVFEDPEDIHDGTGAKLVSEQHFKDSDDDDLAPRSQSKLRARTGALLEEEDVKYAGKRVSRRHLKEAGLLITDSHQDSDEGEPDDDTDSDEATETDDISQSDDDDDDVIKSDEEDEAIQGFKETLKFQEASPNKKAEFSAQSEGDYGQYGGEEEEEDDDEGSEELTSSDQEEETGDLETVQQFTKVNVEDEIQKGKAVKNQLNIWDNLLETRIKLQKAVIIANQLPQPETWNSFLDECGSPYQKALTESQNYLYKLLEQLVSVQTALLAQNPETKSILDTIGQKQIRKPNDEDEEITSESEAESEEESSQSKASNQKLKRKLKMEEYPDFLSKRHKQFLPYRNSTIQKWYDKTRVASGRLNKGFSAFEQSALKQIEQILSDRDRLIKRTQLKRSSYKVLGQDDKSEVPQEDEDDTDHNQAQLPSRDHLKDYDVEIFDDDDFYHQLLRELIERKTSDINDPVALSRQWLEIQKLRSKTKKKVDTRASKGRKIRYNIHPKMVNFMAPYDNSLWTEEAKSELSKSLFGKQQTESNISEDTSR